MTATRSLSPEDHLSLQSAKQRMNNIGWAMKGLNKMGNVIEQRLQLLPQKQQKWLQEISYKVLHTVVKSNLITMQPANVRPPLNRAYKMLVTTSGAVGGALGATAFVMDLTLATKLMMRSIMDIARDEGEDLDTLDTQLACLQVFALGGKSRHDNSLETGYYASRIAIHSTVKGGATLTGKALQGALRGSTNPMLQVLAAVASRFSVQVSEKFVAQAIPLVGAVGGASVNLAFIDHFQQMAQAHFAIRRLERKYGEGVIKETYNRI